MITMPSGMLWKAMPRVTAHDVTSSPFMLTPAAMPSGNLCMAMAMTKSMMRFSDALLRCSSVSRPVMVCMWGVTRSMTFRKKAPAITPITIPHQGIPSPVASKAGTISPMVDAASIIPAQYPRTVSFHLCGNSFIKKPSTEPSMVAPHSPAALISTCCIVCVLFIILPQRYNKISKTRTCNFSADVHVTIYR